jgi:hypothetical protein
VVAVDRKEEGIRVRCRDKKQKEKISMKRLYAILIAMAMLILFVPTAAMAAGGSGFPTWSQHFTKGRFTVLPLFGSAAVFDKETGLVWEKSPSTNTFTWFNALTQCYTLGVGGRRGWRLPTIEELASLVDTSQPAPMLPAGNPFTGVEEADYWSATTDASNAADAWVVPFNNGDVGRGAKDSDRLVWCVRGGQGIDGVQ